MTYRNYLKSSGTNLKRLDDLFEDNNYKTINTIGLYVFTKPIEALTIFYISKGIDNVKDLVKILECNEQYLEDLLTTLKKNNLIKKVWVLNSNSR